MLLSLVETIFVMYLMEKDNVSQDKKANRDQSLSEDCGEKQGKVKFNNFNRGETRKHLRQLFVNSDFF